MKEIWKKIEFLDNYEVSNLGNLRNIKHKILKGAINGAGYLNNVLYKNGQYKNYTRHRLIAKTFLKNDNNLEFVNHKDGNKLNNNINNLEWCTRSFNEKHAFQMGLKDNKKGEEHNACSKLNNKTVVEIFNLSINKIKTNREIAKMYNISETYVSNIKSKRKWKHILENL